MTAIVRELFHHQAHADASMLVAIKGHDVASNDDELRKLFHHILVAHRYWLHLGQGLPFSVESESIVPGTLQEIIARFQETHQQEGVWLDQLNEADMARVVELIQPHTFRAGKSPWAKPSHKCACTARGTALSAPRDSACWEANRHQLTTSSG